MKVHLVKKVKFIQLVKEWKIDNFMAFYHIPESVIGRNMKFIITISLKNSYNLKKFNQLQD